MKQLVLLLLAIGTTLAQPAVAQSPGGGERVRVAGFSEHPYASGTMFQSLSTESVGKIE